MDLTPTPYPEINLELNRLQTALHALLRARLVGLYLHGSLAHGDFNPARSDIDFLAVMDGELTAGEVEALAHMHTQLAHNGGYWAKRLEGSYIPLAALRRYDPQDAEHPAWHEGSFAVKAHNSDWVIERWIVRERGVTLFGPPTERLIDPVSAADLQQAVQNILGEWWAPMLADPSFLRTREYQAFATLTMCRSLHTLATGEVGGKGAAAAWARARLDLPWAGLIERALAWPAAGEQADELAETLDFIRFTLAQAHLSSGLPSK